MEPVFLSPTNKQLPCFIEFTDLDMTNYLFRAYGAIYGFDLEENYVRMMGLYNPSESLASLINKLEKG